MSNLFKKKEISNKSWTGSISGKTFENYLFNELIVRQAQINDSNFSNCDFKNCQLGFHTSYLNCSFVKCKFSGKYGSLGSPAKFSNCKFIDCNFSGLDLFTGVEFYSCLISGKFKNVILRDEHPNIINNGTVFNNCNLSDLTFDNVTIYGHKIFVETIMPTTGIRLFNNSDDILIKRASQICSKITTNTKIQSEIIFKESLRSKQNPIILENLFLNSFLSDQSSKDLFESIVLGYELKDNATS